jgi:hypothetical protein
MSLTEALAQPVLKRRFEDSFPKALYSKFPVFSSVPKFTDLNGDDFHMALQNETPQAAGSTYADAAASYVASTYNRFFVTKVYHYSLARIRGPVADAAAAKNDGAFADLMTNEADGAMKTEMKDEEIYMFGLGDGVRGAISSTSTVASTTISLANGDDIVKFDLGMIVEAYTAAGFGGTKRVGSAQITGIVRDPGNPQLSTGSNWSAQITSLAVGDVLVRKSDGHAAGVAKVITGLRGWVPGGTTPGTLFSCNRNTDPLRLAGQTKDFTGESPEVAAIEAEALLGVQGAGGEGKVMVCHTRDLASLKKVAVGKIQYDRMEGATAGLSFKTVVLDGDYGPIRIIGSPFATRGEAFLGDIGTLKLRSMGKWPKVLGLDGQKWLRLSTDDAYEIRCGGYGFFEVLSPFEWFRLTGFAA